MRDRVLANHPHARLQVYAVWFPVLVGDSSLTLDPRLLSDSRVTNFWDPGRKVGEWFSAKVTNEPGVTWDTYFLFGTDARWEDTPAPVVSSGSPVIGSLDSLMADFKGLGAGN